MATRRKTSAKSKSGMLSGIVIGLVAGLAAAVAVALYITKAPMPFMDKASREIENILLPDVRHAPDPNIGLYGEFSDLDQPIFSGKEAQLAKELGSIITTPPAITPPAIPPAVNQATDTLGSLIAQLPNPNNPSPTTPPTPVKPVAKPAQVAAAATTYYLQAGAFRSAKDADSIKARILMMGLNVTVQEGPYNGSTINRVRVGPFKGVDEMNRARALLGKEKIETSVVRP